MEPAIPPDLPQRARAALGDVLDPEVGESIVDLGLVDRVEVDQGRVFVTLLATSATCPMADLLIDDATEAVMRVLPPGVGVDVDIDWDRTWTPARMSPALRERFGWPGGGSAA
jgi:metal-sulfur cluster biosynthetic enzyme